MTVKRLIGAAATAAVLLGTMAAPALASNSGDGSDYGTMPGYATATGNTVCADHGSFDAFGKGANLGEMARSGFPVPPGFCTTVASYDAFMQENNISAKIYENLKGINVESTDELTGASHNIQRLIARSPIPKEVASEVVKYYKKLSGPFKEIHALYHSSKS